MDTYLVCGGLRLRLYFCFFFTPASNCGGGWFCFVSVRQRFCAEKMTRLTMGTDETTSSHRIFLFFHGCRHAPPPTTYRVSHQEYAQSTYRTNTELPWLLPSFHPFVDSQSNCSHCIYSFTCSILQLRWQLKMRN